MAVLRQAGIEVAYEVYTSLDPANAPARTYLKYCYELAVRYGLQKQVHFDMRFLDIDDAIARISQCDVGLMLYDDVNEGASGAIRAMLRANIPLLVSESGIFSDVAQVCRSVGPKSFEPGAHLASVDCRSCRAPGAS